MKSRNLRRKRSQEDNFRRKKINMFPAQIRLFSDPVTIRSQKQHRKSNRKCLMYNRLHPGNFLIFRSKIDNLHHTINRGKDSWMILTPRKRCDLWSKQGIPIEDPKTVEKCLEPCLIESWMTTWRNARDLWLR